MTDDERLGHAVLNFVIESGLVSADVDEDGCWTGILVWKGPAPEQIGAHLKRLMAERMGRLSRKSNAQAQTISLLHDRVAQERYRRRSAEKYGHQMRRVVHRLADEAVSAVATDAWSDRERCDYREFLLDSVGFNKMESL